MCGKPCERARACEIRRPRPGVVSCWIAKRGTSRPLDLIFAAAETTTWTPSRRRSVSSQDGAATAAAEKQGETHTTLRATKRRLCRGALLLHSSHLSAAWVWLMGWIFRFWGWLLLTHHSTLAAAPPNNSNFGARHQLANDDDASPKRGAPCGPSLTSSSSSSIGL